MEEFLVIGKIVNTHGIRGEIRLLSRFKYKDKVFVKDMPIYIGRNKDKEIINSYRHHKTFEMITLVGYNNINQVLKYKGQMAYIKKSDLKLNDNEYLDSELIDLDVVIDNEIVGKVTAVNDNGGGNKTLTLLINNKESFVPLIPEFVKVSIKEKKVYVSPIEGMIL